MSTNFLFRPINAISKSLRSSCNDEEKSIVPASSQQDEKPPPAINGAVASEQTNNNGVITQASTTVSPPMDPSPTKLDTASQQNSITQEEKKEMAENKQSGNKRRRKKRRSELDNLSTWNVTTADGGADEKANATKRTSRVRTSDPAVTPSPGKKRARHIGGRDNDTEEEVPRKRAAKNIESTVQYAATLDSMEEPPSEPRKRAAGKVGAATKQDVNDGDDKKDAEDDFFASQKQAGSRNVAPPASDETNDSGGDDTQVQRKRGRPKKTVVLASNAGIPEPLSLRRMPSRRATNKKKHHGSFLYYDNDEMDDSDSFSESSSEELDQDDDCLFDNGGDYEYKPPSAKYRGTDMETKKVRGPWSDEEKLLCLLGLKKFGRRNWEKINRTYLPTWSARQIRARAQKLLREQDSGKNIFAPLKGKKALLKKLIAIQHAKAPKVEPSELIDVPAKWTKEEELLFLYGLNHFGRGKWQEIHESFLPTRDRVKIRQHAQQFLQRQDDGEDIFAPLRAKKALVQKLIARNKATAAIAPTRTAAVSIPRRAFPVRVRKIYNVAAIEQIALAKLSSSMPKSAIKFCRDALMAWYVDAEKVVADSSADLASKAADLEPVRDSIAKLWCLYAQVVSKVLEAGNASSGEELLEEGADVEMTVLDLARSCPLVGAHHEVVLARLDHEYGDHDFLRTVSSDTLEGFADAMASINVCEAGKMMEILSSVISMCNDAIREAPGNFLISLDTLKEGKTATNSNEEAGQECHWIADSISALGDSVASLRSVWHPPHYIVDYESTSVLCKEVNRLSRIKEALLDSKDDEGPIIEYSCDNGCCAVFANKRDLLDHQKSCRGIDKIATGDHDRFETAGIRNRNGSRVRKERRGSKKADIVVLKTGGPTRNPHGSTEHCMQVEYGCSHHGCLCVFATKGEVVDHEKSCGENDAVGTVTSDCW